MHVFVAINSLNYLSCVLMMLIPNYLYLFAILKYKPFVSNENHYKTIFLELCLCCALSSAVALAIMDTLSEQEPGIRVNLGWIIVYTNLLTMYVLVFFNLK